MKHFLILLLLIQQSVYGQISTRQISLVDNMSDSAIVFNKYDNRIVINGWQPDMQVSFDRCTVQHINGDTFNVKANFTGTDQLHIKKGDRVLYEKNYQVRSFATAAANTGMLSNTATIAQVLESLAPVHKSATNSDVRVAFLPKEKDPYVVEVRGAGRNNPDVRKLCSMMQSGDKIIIEFHGTKMGSRVVTLR